MCPTINILKHVTSVHKIQIAVIISKWWNSYIYIHIHMFAVNYMKSNTEHLVSYYFNNNDLEMGSLFKEYQ